jgi:hypothetical protein
MADEYLARLATGDTVILTENDSNNSNASNRLLSKSLSNDSQWQSTTV